MKYLNPLLVLSLFLGSFAFASGPDPMDQRIFESVSAPHLIQILRDIAGVDPVTVFGQTYSITDRYSPASKAKFRNYFRKFRGEI